MANGKAPLAVTMSESPPLSARTSVPESPLTVPPTVKDAVTHCTATFTSKLAVPVPPVTVHVWGGEAGCVCTVTA